MINETVKAPLSFIARINENGRIVIPAALREQLGLGPGDAVVMQIEDGVLRIESHRTHIMKIQKEFVKPAAPGAKLPSTQLIEDREEEASQEMEPWLG